MAMRGLLLPTVAAVLLLLTVTQASNDLTIPQQQRQAATTECTLNCPNDAPCRFGQADFSGHIVEVVGQQQQQATDTSQNGGMMHCDCPMGWTGLLCDHRFDTCDNQAGHTCYHGGECIPGLEDKYGNEQLFCDCSQAVSSDDGTRYVGKYCETPFEQSCNPGAPEDELVFCVNGGECNPNFPETSSRPCLCDDDWSGFHCEFKKGSVPDCTLDCQNGGECLVGVASPAEAEHMTHKWSPQEVEDHMRCACPPGVGGTLCEAPAEACGDGICLNGGTCVTTTQVNNHNSKSYTQHHCDCTTAGDDQGNFFAGKYCEHAATAMCSETDWNLFCTQGGECRINPIQGCKCPTGTAGYKCEFLLDNMQNEIQDDHEEEGEDLFDDDDDDDDDGPPTTRCGDGYCQNGAACIIQEDISGNGVEEIGETCDCTTTTVSGFFFGGDFCQYKATTDCFNGHYCFHHGSCISDGLCECPSGWTGKHCDQEMPDDDVTAGDGSGEICGEAVCYNGGVCAETEMIGPDGSLEITLHCDCSSAFDDSYSYAGINCQFPSTSLCTQPAQGDDLAEVLYCVNDGTCMDNPQLGCDCPPGFYGFACEYEDQLHDTDKDGIPDMEDEDDDSLGNWEICGDDGLVCHNGGRCQTTVIQNELNGGTETKHECDCQTAFEDGVVYLGKSCEYPATAVCEPADDEEAPTMAIVCTNHGTCKQDVSEGCDCPDGFTGAACQFKTHIEDIVVVGPGEDPIDYEECGEDLVCLNGGRCTTTIVAGNGGETMEIQHCDCSTAFDETEIFAGFSCEHKASSLCASPTDGSVGNIHFCTNGGECPIDSLMMPCKCNSAWQGFHCEFAVGPDDLPDFHDDFEDDDSLDCNLPCQNGGVCANGAKDIGSFDEVISDVSHLNQTFDKEYFAHCMCPEGFVGLTCQHSVAVCGEEDHVCLHGSTCIDHEDGRHSCDCSQADEVIGSNDQRLFAGESCQYAGSDICTLGEDYPGKPMYFCVNGGICNAQVTPDQPDPGCTCPSGYVGLHCEQRIRTKSSSAATKSRKTGVILIVGVAMAAVFFIVVVLAVRWNRNRESPDRDQSAKGTGTPFPRRRRRKAGYIASNFAPPKQNRLDITSSETRSSSDPIASGFALPPDDEPEHGDDVDGIMKDDMGGDEPGFVDVGQQQDEDGNHLDNVDFV